MGKRKLGELTQEDLEKAKQRAIDAPPLPDEVRRQLVLLLKRQDALPSDFRSLVAWIPKPSGWVITHLVPLISERFSNSLRREGNEASLVVAKRLEKVSQVIVDDPALAVHILVDSLPKGTGSKKAGEIQISILRILDLGILGLPVVASVYAKYLGVIDTSTILLADGDLPVKDALKAAEKLDEDIKWTLSKGDEEYSSIEIIYSELLPPDDFNSIPIG